MFRTKEDVKRHVQEIFRKIKNENERYRRCYNIAQQFYKVRDFESAKQYLSLYISVKEDSPLAYKLQGQIWEALGDNVRALNSYKTSLEYDAKQADIILKLCELLCETDVAMDLDRAQLWCERGSDIFPYDPTIFRLKEKLLKLSGKSNNQAVEDLIKSELRARPDDLSVRTRLMRLYLETGRTKAALSHALELEHNATFRNQLAWYECFAQVCKVFSEEFSSLVNWKIYCTWVSVLDRVCMLSVLESASGKKLLDCIRVVFSLDQILFKAANCTAIKEHSELYKQFIKHMTGQLCLHISTLIFMCTKKEPSNWKEASLRVSPLLFLASVPPLDTESPWNLAVGADLKRSLALWANDGHYRVSQAGYILLSLGKEPGTEAKLKEGKSPGRKEKAVENLFLEKVARMVATNWRENIYQSLFMVLDHSTNAAATSQLVQSELLAKMVHRLPTHNSGFLTTQRLVPVYEKARGGLHHLVWLGLETVKYNKKIPPDFHTYSFTRLKLSTHNLNNMSPDTLTVLDVDAFLYATTLCAVAKLEDELAKGYYSNDRPATLPADIISLLCSSEHTQWWDSACQVNSTQFSPSTNLVVLRQQLQRGLATVRVDTNHGLDVQLVVRMAQTFAERAATVNGRGGDQKALESRALMYWNAALPLLERIEKNQTVRTSSANYFTYPCKELSTTEALNFLEEGRYFIACQYMKSEQYEEAIEAFKPLRSPYASFNQALIYKKQAHLVLEECSKEEITSEMRSKHVILLSKAREYLNLTQERIRVDKHHPLHNTLSRHITDVETALSQIEPEPDMVNQNDGELNVSEQSLSSLGSNHAGGDHSVAPKVNSRALHHSSTPRRQNQSENKRQRLAEVVDVTQLLQVQTLHNEMKKIHEKLDLIVETVNDLKRDVNKLKPTTGDDLYLFGEEEEYPEDVLNNQYPSPFCASYTAPAQATPTFYPALTRGIQGTSTVTYGAPSAVPPPPILPLIPLRMPIDPVLAGYPPAFYNQGPLPFSETQHLPNYLVPKPVIASPQSTAPPVNVIITVSDTLPTGPPPVQPTLSVTIPPQHRLGPVSTPPHNFQIAMPATATTPNLEKSPISLPNEDLDSEDDDDVGYDPCPNFKPIVPLPNEVSVTTGEEEDDVLLENRAKLFRYVEKEWKERGVGVVKILKNRATNKVRLLMRRDQVHKICANHLLRSDMDLTTLTNSDRAWVWVANDFAEEVVRLEKFCIKFKTPEEAASFKDVFNKAKISCNQSPEKPQDEQLAKTDLISNKLSTASEGKQVESSGKVNLGGFTFTSTPMLKEIKDDTTKVGEENKKDTPVMKSPFAAFKFSSHAQAGNGTSSQFNNFQVQSTKPLFAGLSSIQNKHSIFDKDSEVTSSTETSSKVLLKQSVLPSVQGSFPQDVPSVHPITQNIKENIGGQVQKAVPHPIFGSKPQTQLQLNASKETPKSILKEPPATSLANLASKSPSSTKHVLFKDSLSQQSPTLTALLTAPKTDVLDFAALSKMNENKQQLAFDTSKEQTGFDGAGSAVFGTTREKKDSEGENAEEFVPSAEFKPLIPLPDLVDIKTGEEDEVVLFNQRSKLLRFDSATKEWKERGLGQMKILRDTKTGVTRFLMRREHVHKVCCNHRITQRIKLRASPTSEKAWTWYAVDYSEGEAKNELFAIRFKTEELAQHFKEQVESIQKQIREDSGSKRCCPDPGEEMSSLNNTWKCQFCQFSNSAEITSCKSCLKPKNHSNSLPKLSEIFRPKAGSWECKACYTVNGIKDNTCVSCDTPKEKPKSPSRSVAPVPSGTGPSLTEMFKPKAGSWECGGCLVRNDSDKTVCPACGTAKLGHENDAKDSRTGSTGSNAFSFGLKQTESPCTFSFGIPTTTENKGSGVSLGTKPVADSSISFSFGTKAVETVKPFQIDLNKLHSAENQDKPVTEPVTGFSFASTSTPNSKTPIVFPIKTPVLTSENSMNKVPEKFSSFKFGSIFGDSTPTSSSPAAFTVSQGSDSKNKFAFGNTGQFEFHFSGVKAPSPKSPRSGHESESEPEEDEDSYEADHIVFQPVVPLPDKVPVTTGEEEEAVLYSHRAKLFRFAKGEWKERGLGDIKILRHHNTKKIRLLMRREPIMKICLNHFLTPDLTFTPKDDKTWLWSAPDYAEHQITTEQFCIRFKTKEVASEFKAAIDSAKGEIEIGQSEHASSAPEGTTINASDLELLYEAKVSEDLKEAAIKLMLPPNFYRYMEAPPCSGCIGCQSDSEEEIDQLMKYSTPIIKSSNISATLTSSTVSPSNLSAVKPTSFTTKPISSSKSTSAAQPLTFTVKTTSSTKESTPLFTKTSATQPITFSVKSTSSSAATKTLFTTTSATQPVTFPVKSTLSTAAPKTLSTTTSTSQPFTFSVKPTSLITESKTSSTTTSASQLFAFSLKSTSSTTEPKTSSTTSAPHQFPFPVKSTSTMIDPTHLSTLTSAAQPFTCTVKPTSLTIESQISSAISSAAEPNTSTTVSAPQQFTIPLKSSTPTTNAPLLGSGELKANIVAETFSSNPIASIKRAPMVDSYSDNPIFPQNSMSSAEPSSNNPIFAVKPMSLAEPSSNNSIFSMTPTFSATPTTIQSSFVFSLNTTHAPVVTQSQYLFGGSPAVTSETPTSTKTGTMLFGTPLYAQSATTLSFGGSQVTSSNVLITPTQTSPSTVQSSLGSPSLFGNITSFQTSNSLFGGSSLSSNTQFGTTNSVFGTPKAQGDNTCNSVPTFLFKDTTTFSDIAASGKQPAFESASNFKWSGAGKPVFGGKKDKDSGEESGGEDEEPADTSHDPVFEPIVPLPETIEVRTGEEEEDILFCERAKFYRYDPNVKEWKERGTGNMKILKHQQTSSYRLLLRREQVHKVVCNQLVVEDTELKPLTATSDKAFCWAAMNMAEEYSEPLLEQVAVRFKNGDLAAEFKSTLDKCIAEIKVNKEISISGILDSSGELLEPRVDIEEVTNEDSEDEFDYEDIDDAPIFEKEMTLYLRPKESNVWEKHSRGFLSFYQPGQGDFFGSQTMFLYIKFEDGIDRVFTVHPNTDKVKALSDTEVQFTASGEHTDDDFQEYKAEFSKHDYAFEFISTLTEMLELCSELEDRLC